MVSMSGSPAATSDPKARTRMASVTGHEKSSERIIAVRFAMLKSDHMPDAPVRLTCTPAVPAAASGPFNESAAATMPVGSRRAPASITAVCPSREIETARAGRTTVDTALLARSIRSARFNAPANAASPTRCVGE